MHFMLFHRYTLFRIIGPVFFYRGVISYVVKVNWNTTYSISFSYVGVYRWWGDSKYIRRTTMEDIKTTIASVNPLRKTLKQLLSVLIHYSRTIAHDVLYA